MLDRAKIDNSKDRKIKVPNGGCHTQFVALLQITCFQLRKTNSCPWYINVFWSVVDPEKIFIKELATNHKLEIKNRGGTTISAILVGVHPRNTYTQGLKTIHVVV